MTLLNMVIELPKNKAFDLHCLADCNFLSKIFASKIISLKQESELKTNSQCQRRLVNMRGRQFIEEIIHLSEDKLIYQIEGQGPVKHHQGEINYINGTETHYLRYKIYGQSNTWLPTWLLKIVMKYDFNLMAKRLRKSLNER